MECRPYEAFAETYDALTAGFWEHHAQRLDDLLAPACAKPGRALDLACGTGAGVAYLGSRGFTPVGVDLEPEMIRVARQRLPHAELHVADLRQLPELGCFQAVICCFDSINYLLDADEWRALFRNVYDRLEPGGQFVFDVLRLDDLERNWAGRHVRVQEDPAGLCLERCSYDAHRRIGTTRRTFFHPETARSWRRSDELHEQTTFDPVDIEAWLLRAGFTAVHVSDPGDVTEIPDWCHRVIVAASRCRPSGTAGGPVSSSATIRRQKSI